MTRRLLAVLALLSGLAALHAPAHASRLDQLSYDVQALADAVNAKGGAACQCERPPQKRNRVCEEAEVKAMRPRLLGILPPSLVVGADRALE
ncbi:MAG: hypothetical protein AAFZ11_03330 [Pseudomonadota bacterium]